MAPPIERYSLWCSTPPSSMRKTGQKTRTTVVDNKSTGCGDSGQERRPSDASRFMPLFTICSAAVGISCELRIIAFFEIGHSTLGIR